MDKKRLISFTQTLIRERSLSGEEKNVVLKITSEMKSLGFDQISIDEYGSAVGIIKGEKPGKTLLLDGHCDIVDADKSGWKHNPFDAVIEDGSLYGRGVADMKGSLAAMMYAAANIDRHQLSGNVVVSASVLEEVMEGAALKVVIENHKPDYVIIGEATNFNLNRAGRGRAEIIAETFGKSAHSSSPEVGLCAVHEMIKLIEAIEGLTFSSDPIIGHSQITLTDIISEPFPGHSVVPNHCRASFDRRLIPGETPETILASMEILPALQSIKHKISFLDGEEKTYTGKIVKGLKFFPAWIFEEDHFLVQAALKGLKDAGFNSELGAFKFCTNGSYSAGIAGIPTIGFGPGNESDAHINNESLKVNDIERAYDGYIYLIQSILS